MHGSTTSIDHSITHNILVSSRYQPIYPVRLRSLAFDRLLSPFVCLPSTMTSSPSPDTLASVFEQLVLHLPDDQRQALANQVAALVQPSTASVAPNTHHSPSHITPSSHPHPYAPSNTPPRPPTGNYANFSPFNPAPPAFSSPFARISQHVFPDLSALDSPSLGSIPMVGSIPHPSTRGVTVQDRSHQKSAFPFYVVLGGPWRGIFDSYAEAWAASIGFQGAGNPVGFPSWESAEDFYFTSDTPTLPVPPPYLSPTISHLPRHGYWLQQYYPITYDDRLRSSHDRDRWLHNNVPHPHLPIRVDAVRPLRPDPVPPPSTVPVPPPSSAPPPPPHPFEDDFTIINSVPSVHSSGGPFPSHISITPSMTSSSHLPFLSPSIHGPSATPPTHPPLV